MSNFSPQISPTYHRVGNHPDNFVSMIEWDTPRTDKSLKQLMQKRFDVVLGDQDSAQVSWEVVFDESKEMPGRQTKYRHILDRTYLRPRDMIKFCNLALKHHQTRIRDSGQNSLIKTKIENVDINNARPEYSYYLLEELDDEIHKHLPDYREYLELIRLIGVGQFEKQQFEEFCNAQGNTLNLSPIKILQELYQFSVIGFYRSGGRGYGGSEYLFRYKEPRTKFDTNAPRFRVHLGLVDALGLKRW